LGKANIECVKPHGNSKYAKAYRIELLRTLYLICILRCSISSIFHPNVL